jgi:hypothetical protein
LTLIGIHISDRDVGRLEQAFLEAPIAGEATVGGAE